MRHLQQPSSVVEHLAAVAAAPALAASSSSAGAVHVHTDTLLILAAVLCFLLCVVGLAFVARCSRLCNPSAYSVDAESAGAAMPVAAAARKGVEREALRKLPTVAFGETAGCRRPREEQEEEEEEERAECAICLAEFARGDRVRVLPPCGHRFHADCVDTWLLSSSTCPSCRSALVLVVAPPPASTADPPRCCAPAQASTTEPAQDAVVERGPCRTSVP